jgi:hypothetical protein
MTTLHRGFQVTRLAVLFAAVVSLGSAATPKPTPTEKKTETPKSADAPAAAQVVVDFKVSVKGEDHIPASSSVELSGLDNCQPSLLETMNAEGQGKFRSLPTCVVRLKIFLRGEPTRIALIHVAQYKGSPVQIEVTSSSQEAKVTYP